VSRSSRQRRNDGGLSVDISNADPQAKKIATLIVPEKPVGVRIEKTGVWIQHLQHAANGVVQTFLRIHGVGIIFLGQAQHVRVGLQELVEILRCPGGGLQLAIPKSGHQRSCQNNQQRQSASILVHGTLLLLDLRKPYHRGEQKAKTKSCYKSKTGTKG
jgi:hypothetical protein